MPVPSTAIKRVELGATFAEFDLDMSRKGFIGNQLFRPRMSAIQSGDVPLIPLEALLQLQSTKRAAGASYKRGQFEYTSYSFATEEYGWEEPLDDRTLRIFRDLIEAESIAASRAMDFILREYEISVSAIASSTTTWTGAPLTTAAVALWSNTATGVPVTDIHAAIEKVKNSGGVYPNTVVMNDRQMRNCTDTDQIISRLKFWGGDDPKNLTASVLSELFQVRRILVSNFALKNTANEAVNAVIANIWPDTDIMIGRYAETEDPMETCVGRTIMFSEESAGPGGDDGIAVIAEEYREERTRSRILRMRTDYTLVTLYKEAAHRISGIL